jgi:hypothetical protein
MMPQDRVEWEKILAAEREKLGEAAFEALAEEGRSLTLEQAVTQVTAE